MNAQIISFKCVLKTRIGKLISSTYNRDVLTIQSDATEGYLRGLNTKLRDLKKGERRVISLSAEEAYGLYDPNKIILFPASKLHKNLKKGDSVQIVGKSGVMRTYTILDYSSGFARLDGNHPLAGQDLIFEIDALDVRDATIKEIEESLNFISDQMIH